jgi:hypothetical protein
MRVFLAFLLLVSWASGVVVREGVAPYYSPGVMERVSRHRDLPLVDCMVSSPRYPIGTWVYVYGANTDILLWCRVTDVSHPRDRARHLKTHREVELGYTEAVRLCGRKAMRDRPERCPVVVVYFAEAHDAEGRTADLDALALAALGKAPPPAAPSVLRVSSCSEMDRRALPRPRPRWRVGCEVTP